MKKKNLNSLTLNKHKVSNLAMIYNKLGGAETTETEAKTQPIIISDNYCESVHYSCQTGGNGTQAPPPTEHEGCRKLGMLP